MKKITISLLLVVLTACSKPDPILPGTRNSIFYTNDIQVLNKPASGLPENIKTDEQTCNYTQDNSNVIWDGKKKIFSGFPSANFVAADKKPTCSGKFVYVGLTTGEVVKINPKTKEIAWVADVFRTSNMTGGSSILDIVAPIAVHGGYAYAAGLGDAFCKLSENTGDKKWCIDIGTANKFVIAGDFAFLVGTDNNLYAINIKDGSVYWKTEIEEQTTPKYENKIIIVGDQEFNAETGNKI